MSGVWYVPRKTIQLIKNAGFADLQEIKISTTDGQAPYSNGSNVDLANSYIKINNTINLFVSFDYSGVTLSDSFGFLNVAQMPYQNTKNVSIYCQNNVSLSWYSNYSAGTTGTNWSRYGTFGSAPSWLGASYGYNPSDSSSSQTIMSFYSSLPSGTPKSWYLPRSFIQQLRSPSGSLVQRFEEIKITTVDGQVPYSDGENIDWDNSYCVYMDFAYPLRMVSFSSISFSEQGSNLIIDYSQSSSINLEFSINNSSSFSIYGSYNYFSSSFKTTYSTPNNLYLSYEIFGFFGAGSQFGSGPFQSVLGTTSLPAYWPYTNSRKWKFNLSGLPTNGVLEGQIATVDGLPPDAGNIDWNQTWLQTPQKSFRNISIDGLITESPTTKYLMANLVGGNFSLSIDFDDSFAGTPQSLYWSSSSSQLNYSSSSEGFINTGWTVSTPLTGAGGYSPSDILLSNATVAENTLVGTTIGTFSTVDSDVGDTFTYTLLPTGFSYSLFSIFGNELKIASNLNYESSSTHSIWVQSADQNGLSYSKEFTISVTNVNETPTNITLSSSSIVENQPSGTTVGTLSTTDPDAGNTFTYTLGGTDAASFSIVGNSLKTAEIFNYEAKSSYSINITSTDQNGLFYNKPFIILVTNVNEAPTNITLSNSSVAENQPSGTTVGTLSTTDQDASNTFTYTLGGTDAASFSIVGSTLKTAALFNYETKSSYSINITSTDQGGLAYTKTFTINVIDVNETPTNILLSNSTILENSSVGTPIGTLTTIDPDVGNTFTYTISGTDAAVFYIGAGLNPALPDVLKLQQAVDYETKNSYSIDITSTDQNGLFFTKAFTITVLNDPNDDGVNLALTDINSVTLLNGIVIATIEGSPLTISVTKNGVALPNGSVVRNSVTGQKFIKIAGNEFAYTAISIVPDVSWNWNQNGIDAWAILQTF